MIFILGQEYLLAISNLKISNLEQLLYQKIVIKKSMCIVDMNITFDSTGSWSFGNDFAKNVVIFGVDNSSSCHADNHKNNFLILSEVPTYGINRVLVHQRKGLVLILVKRTQNFAWVCIRVLIIVIYLLMEKKSLDSKLPIKMLTLQLSFVSEVYLMDLVLLNLEKYL